jgi:nitrate/nitrite-specific signal transduction histidine kinase
VFIVVAVVFLGRKRLWLRNVVTVALMFFFLGEFLFLLNYTTNRDHGYILCPIGNTFHILAIPILGYVYLREQSIEKAEAEEALEAYRDHLEELVEERTVELSAANTRLAAQNAVAGTLSQSLDLDTILHTALDMALAVLDLQVGSVFLLGLDGRRLVQQVKRGQVPVDEHGAEQSAWYEISAQAAARMQGIVFPALDAPEGRAHAGAADAERWTLVSTPLLAKGRALGALTLGARRMDAIQQSGLDLLTAIGQQIGMAIENARLYQEAERWARELTLLHQVSTFLTSTLDAQRIYDQMAEQSTKLLGCQVACVMLWEEDLQEARAISGYGMTESDKRILLSRPDMASFLSDPALDRGAIDVGDLRADPRVPPAWRENLDVRALLCLPMWSVGGPLGFLFLMDRQAPRAWRPEELKLIESFVNRAAVALVNAHLHKQLEWAAALEERQRIAANMHDGLAQTLSLLGLRIDQAGELVGTGAEGTVVEELRRARQVVDQASDDVRRSIASLQETPRPHRSLQDSLSDLAARFSTGDGPPVDLAIRVQEPLYLEPDHGVQVLPVVQEALLNARRHARARRIALVLERRGEAVSITVQDDGQGFDVHAYSQGKQGHFGLSIMRARAARIGGRLQIDSVPGQGTRVSLIWMPKGDLVTIRYDPARPDSTPEALRLGGAAR